MSSNSAFNNHGLMTGWPSKWANRPIWSTFIWPGISQFGFRTGPSTKSQPGIKMILPFKFKLFPKRAKWPLPHVGPREQICQNHPGRCGHLQ
jgi:hypothetical protein